jgi:putative photosynthetic complex assembly protein
MSSETADFRSFPRAPLVGMGALVLMSFLLVVSARLTGTTAALPPPAAAIAERELRFEDRDDGSVVVRDADTGAVIQVLVRGTNGFVRSTMRGLARDRRSRGIGPEIPFRLIARADGSLTLEDPATGHNVPLAAFGPTNAGVFAGFLGPPSEEHRDASRSGATP